MNISFITTTSRDRQNVLYGNLLLTPSVFIKYPLHIIRDSQHITQDLQNVIDSKKSDVLVVLHDDVRLLEGFKDNLLRSLSLLDMIDPNWAVAGVAGATLSDGVIAHIADRQTILGSFIETPIKVDNVDEVLVIINTKHQLKLDVNIKTYHLWATDLCLQASERGLNSYVVEALIHHNSMNGYTLNPDYYKEAEYIRNKWKHRLPFRNTCAIYHEQGVTQI